MMRKVQQSNSVADREFLGGGRRGEGEEVAAPTSKVGSNIIFWSFSPKTA